MSGVLRGGLVALGLGVAMGVATAQQPGTWLPTWLGGKPALKPMDKPDDRPDKRARDNVQREVLMNALMRRQAVCVKLKQIALDTGNMPLFEEAQRLDDLAWELHKQRNSQLGAISTSKDEPKIDPAVMDDTRNLLIETATKKKRSSGDSGSSMVRGGTGR